MVDSMVGTVGAVVKLHVYGGAGYIGGLGGRRIIVAAQSWKAAVQALTAAKYLITVSEMRLVWSITGNAGEIEAAIKAGEGVPLHQPMNAVAAERSKWERLSERNF
jgi:hypothetical protein